MMNRDVCLRSDVQHLLAGIARIDLHLRTRGREQLGFPCAGRAAARDDGTLAGEREEHGQPRERFHSRSACFRRNSTCSAHAVRLAPVLAWKSRPLPVLATKPARITNSPKRSFASRSFA